MSKTYDVIVVGVGTMGAATCWMLARRGVRVLGLERWGIPHGQGSHHGQSRIIRKAYFEHPDYVPLLQRAYENWAELEQRAGRQIVHRTGGIYMGRADSDLIAGSLRSMHEHELPYEMLTREELGRRYPLFTVPGNFVGLWDEDTGFVLPELAVSTFAEQAMREGAVLRGHEPVTGWSVEDGVARVETAANRYEAKRVVFCGGAWSGRLLQGVARDGGDVLRDAPLKVTRQVMGWVWPRRPELFAYGQLPTWVIDDGWGGVHYGVPMMPDRPGLKIALHRVEGETEPDQLRQEVLSGDEATFRPILQNYLPDGDGPLLSLQACLYTNSPDGHFIVDRHPAMEQVVIACGFSGHGFKFASVMGEALADLATEGRSELPIDFLSLRRFAAG